MRIVSIAILLALAFAVEAAAPRRTEAEWTALFLKERRAFALRPARRDSPLREVNISDAEVAQIRGVAASVAPKAIVNISGVVDGCPCEDGPTCSEQVWILAYRSEKTVGLLLSKIGGDWTIGPVQKWWLEYENLESRAKNLGNDAYWEARDMLIQQFPAECPKSQGLTNAAK